MKSSTKISNDYKFGMNGAKKKLGINCWRFVFNAINTVTGSEQMFYIEFEMLNPWNSQEEVLLGFKTRVKISAEDLQYALAGTDSAKSLSTEDIIQPSYCAIRVGAFGTDGKQLCGYYPVKAVKFPVQLDEDGIGADWHPSAKTHEKIAKILSDALKEWM